MTTLLALLAVAVSLGAWLFLRKHHHRGPAAWMFVVPGWPIPFEVSGEIPKAQAKAFV